jgi:hypothetical protein
LKSRLNNVKCNEVDSQENKEKLSLSDRKSRLYVSPYFSERNRSRNRYRTITTINYVKYLIIKLFIIKIKPLKKRNNEIIIQYLSGTTVVFNKPPVVGVSMMRKQVATNLKMRDI